MHSVRPTASSPLAPLYGRSLVSDPGPARPAEPGVRAEQVDGVVLRGGGEPAAVEQPPLPSATAQRAPAPSATAQRAPAPSAPPVCLPMSEVLAPAPPTPRSAASREVAEQCHRIVFGDGELEQKVDAITALLVPGVAAAPSPDPAWPKASAAELRLFVHETLEHTEGIRRVGRLRGLDFDAHDFEGDTSKFNPELAQFLARPGRDASVRWAIDQHNAAPHHRVWHDSASTAADLKESATDVVNAWRMTRRVYQKPAWSWEKIQATIRADFDDGRLSAAQRDALLEAIPFQKECEARFGWYA